MSSVYIDEDARRRTGTIPEVGRFDFKAFAQKYGLDLNWGPAPNPPTVSDSPTSVDLANHAIEFPLNPFSIRNTNQVIPAFVQCSDRRELLVLTVASGVFGLLLYSFFSQRQFLP